MPAGCYSRGDHYLYNLCGDEPVQAKVRRLRQGLRERIEPGQASGEQQGFGDNSGDDSAGEGPAVLLKHITDNKCDQRICQKEPAGDTE